MEAAVSSAPPAIIRQWAVLQQFSNLPAEAFVRRDVVEVLFSCAQSTLWRRVKNGTIPAPHRFNERVCLWQVGELRAALLKVAS